MFDRPSAPKGPVEFSNVTADSITLSWLAPEHDGASAINNYVVHMREKESDQWIEVAGTVARTSIKVSV